MHQVYSSMRLTQGERRFALWLVVLCVLIGLMVVVGGATRLTESGLSIVYWAPVSGALPPLNAADWHREFARYQLSPQYQLINNGMSLAQFKSIFWWEWGHRQLGRIIGLVFVLPLCVFFITDRPLVLRYRRRLIVLLLLGALQGFIGWWMVASGLVHEPKVSPYRLAIHLSNALLILALLVWTWCDLHKSPAIQAPVLPRSWLYAALAAMGIQIILGALVAGHDAGLASDTWPLMDGRLIPRGLWSLTPWWRNIIENDLTLHWLHRSFGLGIALFIVYAMIIVGQHVAYRRLAVWLGVLVVAQVVLGILTVLHHVPVALGAGHQGNAVLLLVVMVMMVHRARGHAFTKRTIS